MEEDWKLTGCCDICTQMEKRIEALEEICRNLPHVLDAQRFIQEEREKKEKKDRQEKANMKAMDDLLKEECDIVWHPDNYIPKDVIGTASAYPKRHWFRQMIRHGQYSGAAYMWQECVKCGVMMDKIGF